MPGSFVWLLCLDCHSPPFDRGHVMQLGTADLPYTDASSLFDHGQALNAMWSGLTVVGGAVLVGGAVT